MTSVQNTLRTAVVFAVFLSVAVPPAAALKCYACLSGPELLQNLACEDPVNTTALTQLECSSNENVCIKAITKNPKGVTRACSTEDFCKKLEASKNSEFCKPCKTDLCNTGIKHSMSTISMFFIGVTSLAATMFAMTAF